MRILLDARYLDGTFSGIATYSQHLVESLARIDRTNEYWVIVQPGFDGTLNVGENFHITSFAARPVSSKTLMSLGATVDALKVDVMHSLFPIAPLRMRTPLLVTLHDLQPFVDPEFSGRRFPLIQAGYNFFYRHVYPATLRKAKWILTASHYTRETLGELFPQYFPKIMVIANGLDESIFEAPPEDPEVVRRRHGIPARYLLYYGSTRPNKNLTNLVRGFAHYLSQVEDKETELVLILKKDRFFRDVARMIRQAGLINRVRVMSQLPAGEQRAILHGARVFVFPTKYEGFGFPALEAMAAGVPVLAGDSGALPEICGDAAELVDPDDPIAIGEALAELIHDEDARRLLIDRGRQRVQRYNWKHTAELVQDVYKLLF